MAECTIKMFCCQMVAVMHCAWEDAPGHGVLGASSTESHSYLGTDLTSNLVWKSRHAHVGRWDALGILLLFELIGGQMLY